MLHVQLGQPATVKKCVFGSNWSQWVELVTMGEEVCVRFLAAQFVAMEESCVRFWLRTVQNKRKTVFDFG